MYEIRLKCGQCGWEATTQDHRSLQDMLELWEQTHPATCGSLTLPGAERPPLVLADDPSGMYADPTTLLSTEGERRCNCPTFQHHVSTCPNNPNLMAFREMLREELRT